MTNPLRRALRRRGLNDLCGFCGLFASVADDCTDGEEYARDKGENDGDDRES